MSDDLDATTTHRVPSFYANRQIIRAYLEAKMGCDCRDGMRVEALDQVGHDTYSPCTRCVLVETDDGIRLRALKAGKTIELLVLPVTEVTDAPPRIRLPKIRSVTPGPHPRYDE